MEKLASRLLNVLKILLALLETIFVNFNVCIEPTLKLFDR
jgi:hypothetical protein